MTEPDTHPNDVDLSQLTVSAEAWLALSDSQRQAEAATRRVLASHSPAFTTIAPPPGRPAGDLSGLPISVKDNIAVEGMPTRAGSLASDTAPATADAPVVASLRRFGASIVGHTTMSEYAYAGTGLDRSNGCPPNPSDPSTIRISGGSSSGAAVSVADGSCLAALGTDTAGSVRIPAALCGLVGYVPSRDLVDHAGIVPLSPTLDRVGVIARSVQDCELVTAHMSTTTPEGDGTAAAPFSKTDITGAPRLVALAAGSGEFPTDPELLAPAVSAAYGHAVDLLTGAGARIVEPEPQTLDLIRSRRVRALAAQITAHEAWTFHAERFTTHEDLYGEWLRTRLRAARELDPDDYAEARAEVDELRTTSQTVLDHVDALILPTVPLTAPTLAEVQSDPVSYNRRLLELTTFLNVLGWCAVTVPLNTPALPVGLLLVAPAGRDSTLLATARWAEQTVSNERKRS